jgi:protein arginine N-methyltransferase 7
MEMPKRHFRYLEDTTRRTAFADAVTLAVDRLREDAKDARVLNIGCGAGLVAMEALRAGAHHVTATDRWLYHAMAAKESLLNNGFSDDQVKVVYKRPTDLAVLRDVPISCNLCVNDMLDDGLLASGIIPSFRHALEKLLLPDAILLPASATVHVMPVEMRVDTVCGLDVSAMNPYRFAPTHTSAVELATDAFVPLAPPVEAWHFDFQNPPEESQTKTVDLAFERDGKFNAVVFWFTLNLIDDIKITTAPLGFAPGEYPGLDPADYDRRPTSLHPAVQFLEGEMEVKEGGLQPMTCVHNTVCMQFRVEEAEYLHLHRRVASFPPVPLRTPEGRGTRAGVRCRHPTSG